MTSIFHLGLLPNRPVAACVDLARAAEELGFEGIWIADSQCVFRDAHSVLSVCAVRTQKLLLAAGVTNPITRHPAVLAGSWATLQEMSGGRAILGIGVGESAIETLGLKPARLADLERVIDLVRRLMRGEAVQHDGHEVRLPWANFHVPVVIAASGPKSLQLAGRIADGVLFQVGAELTFMRYALDNIRIGAEQAGRKLEDVRLYARLACVVHEDRALAREQIKGYAAVAAGTVFRNMPREYFPDALWDELQRMKAQYNYLEHGSDAAGHRALMTDRILDAVSVSGSPDEAIPRLNALRALGVDAFVCPMSMADPLPFMRTFAAAVMPHVR
ncbi:MAG: LLM class flavin-dependent oxidoreductase [Steroidobacteraceae bacterium]